MGTGRERARTSISIADTNVAASAAAERTVPGTEDAQPGQPLSDDWSIVARVLDQVAAFAAVLRPEGDIVEVNRPALEVAGIQAGEVIGKKFWDSYWWSYSPEIRELMQRTCEAAARGDISRFETRARVADGKLLATEFMLAPLRDGSGRITHLVASGTDLTKWQAAEEALRESEEFNRQIIESSPDCIKLLDLQGRLRFMSEGGQKLLGITDVNQYLGMRYTDFWSKEDKPKVEAALSGAMAGGTGMFNAMVPTLQGVPKMWNVVVSPVRGARGDAEKLLVVSRDATVEHAQRERLHALVACSTGLLAAESIPNLLELIAAAARRLTQSAVAVCDLGSGDSKFQLGFSDGSAGAPATGSEAKFKVEKGGVYTELFAEKPSIRYTDAELRVHPLWWGLPQGHLELKGLIGVQIAGPEGKRCGLIMASRKEQGDYTAEDEAVLVQLGVTASLALRHLQAKEEAERRATELHAVFDSMADAVFIRDGEGKVLFANPAAASVFGVSLDDGPEALRTEQGDALSGEQLPYRRALAGEVVRGERFCYISKEGRRFTVLVSASQLKVKVRGEVAGTVSVWHDITEREQLVSELAASRNELEFRVQQRTTDLRKAIHELELEIKSRMAMQEALSESKQRYRTLMEEAPVGIIVTAYSGEVLAANDSFCRMLHTTMDAVRQGNSADFYAIRADSVKLQRVLRARGRMEDYEAKLRRADGTLFDAVLRASAIRFGQENALLITAVDVTARKEAEHHVDGVRRLLELFASKSARSDYLRAVVRLVRDWAGCRCVGIRVLTPDKRLPFAAQVGFTRSFVNAEARVSTSDLNCPCMRALTGCPRPGDEAFIRNGNAFCSEHMTTDVLGLCDTVGARHQIACRQAGHESVFQAGIRYEGQFLGSLHLADSATGKIPNSTIHFVESVAPLIGEALHRFQVEESLSESEERFRALFEKHDSVMLLVNPAKLALVNVNPSACAFFARSRDEMLSLTLKELGIALPATAASMLSAERAEEPFEARVQVHGSERVLSVYCSAVPVRGEQLLFLIVHDVTERRFLQRRIIEIGEQERYRVGQDLHDSLGGHLTGLALVAKALAQQLQSGPTSAAALALEVVEGLNQAISQTRTIAHGLCPVDQMELGIVSSLDKLATDLQRRSGIRCEFKVSGAMPVLDYVVASHLFHIVQEAANNALRHANPTHISISVAETAGALSVRVWNNGKKFDPGASRNPGMGLRTMKYRADLVGARLRIGPAPGGGTLVSCELPAQERRPGKPAPEVRPGDSSLNQELIFGL